MHHRFHISHNTPPLPLKISHFLGTTVIARRNSKQWLCKTSGVNKCIMGNVKMLSRLKQTYSAGLHFSSPALIFAVCPCNLIWDSLWFLIPRCEFQDSRYWILDSLSVELGLRIPVASGIPNSLSYIPDSKAQDSRFAQKNFRFQIPQTKMSWIPESGLPHMRRMLG